MLDSQVLCYSLVLLIYGSTLLNLLAELLATFNVMQA